MEICDYIREYTEVKCILTKQQMATFYGKMPALRGNVSVIEAALPNRTLRIGHLDGELEWNDLKSRFPEAFAQGLNYTGERVYVRIFDPSFREIYDEVVDAFEWSDTVAATILDLHGFYQ